jgi:hypothetical protein
MNNFTSDTEHLEKSKFMLHCETPNYQHLSLCVYQLTETPEGRGGDCISVCEGGGTLLCVLNSLTV